MIRSLFSAPLILSISTTVLVGCQSTNGEQISQESSSPAVEHECPQYSPNQPEGVTKVSSDTFDAEKQMRRKVVYASFYSDIYQPEGQGGTLNFSGMLSIRNTSKSQPIRILNVRYYDSNGKIVKKCLEGEQLLLSPIASTEFGIPYRDNSGGSGANFLIEWASEKVVSDPVVEVVMLSSIGTHSYSLISSGKVIEDLSPQ